MKRVLAQWVFACVTGVVMLAVSVSLGLDASSIAQRRVSFVVVGGLGFAVWLRLRRLRSAGLKQVLWSALGLVALALFVVARRMAWLEHEDFLAEAWFGLISLTWLFGSCLLDEEVHVPPTMLRVAIAAFTATEGQSYFQRFVLEPQEDSIAGLRPELAWVGLAGVALLAARVCGSLSRRVVAIAVFTAVLVAAWFVAGATRQQPWTSLAASWRASTLVLPVAWWWCVQWLFSRRGEVLPWRGLVWSSLGVLVATLLAAGIVKPLTAHVDSALPAWSYLCISLLASWALLTALTVRRDDVGTFVWSVELALSVGGLVWLLGALFRSDWMSSFALPRLMNLWGPRFLSDVVVPAAVAVWFAGVTLRARVPFTAQVALAFMAALVARFGSQLVAAVLLPYSFEYQALFAVSMAPYDSAHSDIVLGVVPCWVVLPLLARELVVRLRGPVGFAVWTFAAVALAVTTSLTVRAFDHSTVQNAGWACVWLVPALWWLGAHQLLGPRAAELQASAVVNVSSNPEPSALTSA